MSGQTTRVLEYLKTKGSITQMEAMEALGCSRLAARIADLRKAGHTIHAERVVKHNRFGERCVVAEYTLISEAEKGALV